MKINLTLDGTPEQIREAIAAALVADATQQAEAQGRKYIEFDEHMACNNAAAELLERAVKDGGAEILLGEVTEQRKLAHAGCI